MGIITKGICYLTLGAFCAYAGMVARPAVDMRTSGYALKTHFLNPQKANPALITSSGLELEISDDGCGVMMGDKEYRSTVTVKFAKEKLETSKLHDIVDSALATKYTSEQLKGTIYSALPKLTVDDRKDIRKTELGNVVEEMKAYITTIFDFK